MYACTNVVTLTRDQKKSLTKKLINGIIINLIKKNWKQAWNMGIQLYINWVYALETRQNKFLKISLTKNLITGFLGHVILLNNRKQAQKQGSTNCTFIGFDSKVDYWFPRTFNTTE